MKKKVFTILSVAAFTVVAAGQITKSTVHPKPVIEDKPYDSTSNFLGKDVYKYIGQELYLKGMYEGLRKSGYQHFFLDYTKFDRYSNYDELAEKYFTVLDVVQHQHKIWGKKNYLKLQEKESKDVVYFEYNSEFEEFNFPFIVVGYFEKLKRLTAGKEFFVRRGWGGSDVDMRTGNPVSVQAGSKWKCIDLTIDERFYWLSYILENDRGEQIPIHIGMEKDTKWVIEATEAERYEKKFGKGNWDIIIQGKVRIGMTKEMCRISWGYPQKINETITANKKSEQWVYDDNYLYFDNEVLTAMQ
jgi:hypothetical protein